MDEGLAVRPIRTQGDINAVRKLIGMVFRGEVELYEGYINCYANGDYSNSLIAILDKRLVAHVLVVPRTMVLDNVTLEVGQIAFAVTHPKYRGLGYFKAVMSAADDLMARKGYQLSYLFGVPYFYRKFAYEYALPDDTFRIASFIDLDQAVPVKKELPALTVEPLKAEHIDKCLSLYSKDASTRSVWMPRGRKVWNFQSNYMRLFSEGEDSDEVVIMDGDEFKGYIKYDVLEDSLKVREVNTTDPKGLAFALEHMMKEAGKRGMNRVYAAIPLDHPFFIYFKSRGGKIVDYTYGGMLKLLNLHALMMKLKVLLNERMAGSELEKYVGTVTLNLYEKHINLRIINGKIRSMDTRMRDPEDMRDMRMSPHQFVQLLTGYKGVEDLLGIPDFRIEEEWIEPLKAIFPRRNPYIYLHDR